MAHGDIIWEDGDTWRDLTDDVRAIGVATVVSLHGATRFIEADRGRQVRVPGQVAHAADFDGRWLPLGDWQLTPCGAVTLHLDHWSCGTRLRLVLAGFVGDWADTKAGAATLAAIEAGAEPTAPGHPAGPCGSTPMLKPPCSATSGTAWVSEPAFVRPQELFDRHVAHRVRRRPLTVQRG